MFYDTARNAHGMAVDPFNAIVVPRPIGWISTSSLQGKANLAPYSYFNAVASRPYYVVFGSSGQKDSLRNIVAMREFAVNLATFDLREHMNTSSSQTDADEFELCKLTKAPCTLISSPRVSESPVTLECTLYHVMPLPADDGAVNDWMVVGRVVGIHIDDSFIVDGRVDTAAMKPLARLGYSEYATIDQVWRMRRPG